MKKLLIIIFLFISPDSYCPPRPPSSHGENNTVGHTPSGSAPIGSGTILLLGLAGTYTGYRIYKAKD